MASLLLSRSRNTLSPASRTSKVDRLEKAALALSASATVALAIATRQGDTSTTARTGSKTNNTSSISLPKTSSRIGVVSCERDYQDMEDPEEEQLLSWLEEDDANEMAVRDDVDVDIYLDEDSDLQDEGFTESIRFEQCLAYHKTLLPEYRKRWDYNNLSKQTTPSASTTWPTHVPLPTEIPSLETDFSYCTRTAGKQTEDRRRYCHNLQFRLAAFYLQQIDEPEMQQKGFKYLKTLSESGHADSMCLYAIVLNEGRVPGLEANPGMATVWWRRAVDDHRHVASTYELAVAFFTGEGVPENEEIAVKYFRRAATLGHPGAAYMLGDCLLDGVGTRRDRAEALEWLVTAGELGHRGARSRVLAVLEMKQGEDYGKFTDSSRQTLADTVDPLGEDEQKKWHHGEEDGTALREASIERRYTIGGGSRNPVVLAKRKTVVAESRKS
jgi:TPR repeat protein